jgi:hypothetical protein
MSALVKAVAALVEVNETIQELIENRIDMLDNMSLPIEERRAIWGSIERLTLIAAPLTPRGPDTYKGLPVRRVEARLWSGIITNPGGFGIPVQGRKKSVYLDGDSNSGADSHGVHYADAE